MHNAHRYPDEASTLHRVHRRNRQSQPFSSAQQYQSPSDPLETIQVSEEAPWDKPGENLIHSWLETAKQQASIHRKRGFRLKQLYKFFGILSIVSAAIVFFFANISVSPVGKTDTLVHIFVAFVNLLVANLNNFLEYGPKYQKQFEFEGKYSKLSVDLEEILAINADFRAPKDRTLAEYKEKIGNLFVNAPEI